MRYCIAKHKHYEEDKLFKIYVTDRLYQLYMAFGGDDGIRYYDIINGSNTSGMTAEQAKQNVFDEFKRLGGE